jgi:hypothetical protein
LQRLEGLLKTLPGARSCRSPREIWGNFSILYANPDACNVCGLRRWHAKHEADYKGMTNYSKNTVPSGRAQRLESQPHADNHPANPDAGSTASFDR